MTDEHCAGHRKSKDELSKGAQSSPFNPHPLLAVQYVDVHPINEDAGVRKDCDRVKKANPMI